MNQLTDVLYNDFIFSEVIEENYDNLSVIE